MTMRRPEHAHLDEAVAYWHGAQGVARRLAAIGASTTALLLFLEHQPHRLDMWLRDRLDAGRATAAEAIEMVDDTLLAPVLWMGQQGLFHFDAHLANLLADERQVLITDFGLATARDSALDAGERRFLDQHRRHDPAYTATKFVNFLVTELTGITDPRARDADIARHASGRGPGGLLPAAEAIVHRYAPVAGRSSTRCTGSCSPYAATSSSRPRNSNGPATGALCRTDPLAQLEAPQRIRRFTACQLCANRPAEGPPIITARLALGAVVHPPPSATARVHERHDRSLAAGTPAWR